MIRLLLPLVVILAIFWFLKTYSSAEAPLRRKMLARLAFGLVFAFVLFLTVTGRLHVIAAVITGLLPFAKKALPFLRYVPLLKRFVQKKSDQGSKTEEAIKATAGAMDESQALKILGLQQGATKDEIVDAHRKLMQKCHPDRGGNDFLAAQLNQAKDFLLG